MLVQRAQQVREVQPGRRARQGRLEVRDLRGQLVQRGRQGLLGQPDLRVLRGQQVRHPALLGQQGQLVQQGRRDRQEQLQGLRDLPDQLGLISRGKEHGRQPHLMR
jgi:hypothetical protein